MYYSVSQASKLLGVCTTTIRRWDSPGKIKCIRTLGNHRRMHRDDVKRIISGKKRVYKRRKRFIVTYVRVSSHINQEEI